MSQRLQHKTALVTGSTSNIGQAIAEAFAAEGAHVIVSGRSRERGTQVVEGIRASGGKGERRARRAAAAQSQLTPVTCHGAG